MAWFKVDENFDTHPKMLGLTGDQLALWVRGLAYSNRHCTDGFIPAAALRLLTSHVAFGDDYQESIDGLCETGLWVEVEEEGFVIPGFLEWNRSKDEREDLSRKRAVAGQRGGQARAKQLASNLSRQDVSKPASPEQKQSRVEKTNPLSERKRPDYTDLFLQFWDEYPRHPDNQKLGGGGVKTDAWNEWQRLSDADRQSALDACGPHARALRKSQTNPKHAERFLRKREFDEYADQLRSVRVEACQTCGGPSDHRHDDLYCSELVSGIQTRKAVGHA